MSCNLFVYGSLVNSDEWNNAICCDYRESRGILTDSRYYLEWNVEVYTRLSSRFYQEGNSNMLSIAKSDISHKNLQGMVYLDIKKIDLNKLSKREDYYDLIRVRVQLENGTIISAWTYKVQNKHKTYGLPKNKIYKSVVFKGYKSRKLDTSQL